MISPAAVLAPPVPRDSRRARSILEAWLLQAVLFRPDEWGRVLLLLLSLGDFVAPVNLGTYRAILLEDGDFVRVGRRLHRELEARDWEKWVDRFCGGYDLPLDGEIPIDEVLRLLRDGDGEAIDRYVYSPGSVLTYTPRAA